MASLPLIFKILFAKPTDRTVRRIWTNEGSKRVVSRKEMPFWWLE